MKRVERMEAEHITSGWLCPQPPDHVLAKQPVTHCHRYKTKSLS